MKCRYHTEKDAVGICNCCSNSVCELCLVVADGKNFCVKCIELKDTKSANHYPTLALVLSIILPGLGQIYNGQIVKGLVIFFSFFLIIPWVFGIFDAYFTAKKIVKKGIKIKQRFGCLVGFVAGLFFLFIGAILMGIIVTIIFASVMHKRITSNEKQTYSNLIYVSKILEDYKKENKRYPLSEDELRNYKNEDFFKNKTKGYEYVKFFGAGGYKIIAKPTRCSATGTKVFILKTGAKIKEESCLSSIEEH